MGTLDNGLAYYINDENLGLWKLLDPVVKSLPDQGIEKPLASSVGHAERKRKRSETPRRERSPLARKLGRGSVRPMKTCLVCKKKREPLCELPQGWRRQMKENSREKKKAAAEAKSKAAPKKPEGD